MYFRWSQLVWMAYSTQSCIWMVSPLLKNLKVSPTVGMCSPYCWKVSPTVGRFSIAEGGFPYWGGFLTLEANCELVCQWVSRSVQWVRSKIRSAQKYLFSRVFDFQVMENDCSDYFRWPIFGEIMVLYSTFHLSLVQPLHNCAHLCYSILLMPTWGAWGWNMHWSQPCKPGVAWKHILY